MINIRFSIICLIFLIYSVSGNQVEASILNRIIYLMVGYAYNNQIHIFNNHIGVGRYLMSSHGMHGPIRITGPFWSIHHVFGSIIGMWPMCCPFTVRSR